MQNNTMHLKRDTFFAIIIPVALFGLSQVAFKTFSWWGLAAAGVVGGLCLFQFVYKFINKIEDGTWHQQLNSIIQRVSTPVIVADINYAITFANQSINRMPVANLIAKVDNIIDLLAVQDNKLNSTVKDTLDGLTGKLKCLIEWSDKNYICTIIPLLSPEGKRWGMLLEFQEESPSVVNVTEASGKFDTLAKANEQPKIATYEKFESTVEKLPEENNGKFDIVTNAIKHTSHPLVILNENQAIEQTSDNFLQLINSDNDSVIGRNMVDLLDEEIPNVSKSLKAALSTGKSATFVAEHFNQICDWVISPIEVDNNLNGYIIEIMYPSKQEFRALEENAERLTQSKQSIETELRHFTQGLANCKLYQKGNDLIVDDINYDYQHPLIKNSSKIMYQLYSDLHHLHGELDSVKSSLESNTQTTSLSIPLKQVNALSNALSRNVYEAELDLTALHQELSKLKGLLAEQKGLNQVYMKPLSRALSATEQALLKTVNHTETVTLILQQISENQSFLAQLQEFIVRIAKLPRSTESGQTAEIYQEIISLLDRVKNTLSVGILKLKELLINFDGLNTCWKQAQENLQACLHSGTSMDQTSKRCSAMSNTAHDYSQLLQDKIAQIIDITQSLQERTSGAEIVIESQQVSSGMNRQFAKKIIEVDETKRKAEDVLLEGLAKF